MSVPHRRVRLLVEVDALVFNEDMDDAALGPAVAGWVATIVREAEDKAVEEAVEGIIYPLDYRLDADDATVWAPTKYIGALLAVRRLSKTARDKLRKYDRLPAADRRALLVDRLSRNHRPCGPVGFARCALCGNDRPYVAGRSDGKQYDPTRPCPSCGAQSKSPLP